MNGWDTPTDTAADDQAYYRRRIIRALRGWLYQHSNPRTLTTCLLAISLATGNVVAAGLPRHGLWTPAVWALEAVAVAWPIFMAFLYWQMLLVFENFNGMDDIARLLEKDRHEHASLTADDSIDHSTGMAAALTEGGCLGALAYFALAALGIMLLDLVRESPTLLSEMYLDGELVVKHPQLFGSVKQGTWLSNLFISTTLQFFFTALSASILAMLVAWVIVDPQGAKLLFFHSRSYLWRF